MVAKTKPKPKPKPKSAGKDTAAYWSHQALPTWAGKYAKPGGGGVEKWRADELAFYQKQDQAKAGQTAYSGSFSGEGSLLGAAIGGATLTGSKSGAYQAKDAAQLAHMNHALPHPHKKTGLSKYGPGLAIAGAVLGGAALTGALGGAGAAGGTAAATGATEVGGAAAGIGGTAAEFAAGGAGLVAEGGNVLDDAFGWLNQAGQYAQQGRGALEQLGADFGLGGGGGSDQAPAPRAAGGGGASSGAWSKYGLWIVGGLGAVILVALLFRRK